MKNIFISLLISMSCIFGLEIGHANYIKNIDDEIKVYQIELKVDFLLNNIKDENKKKLLKQKVQQKIEKILGKTPDEIIGTAHNQKDFSTFKEYLLYRIYEQISVAGKYFSGNPRIVENDYVRALVFSDKEEDILVKHDAIYNVIYRLYEMVEFFYIPDNMSAEDFIQDRFIGKLYDGKCRISETYDSGNQRFWIGAYGDYKQSLETPEASMRGDWMGACGPYGQTNGVQYFELLSSNVLMFARPGQGGIPIDLSTIEVKDNITPTIEKQVKNFGSGLIVKATKDKLYLYKGNKLIYKSYAIEGITGIVQGEVGKNGLYVLRIGENGFSELIMFDVFGDNKKILKVGNPDSGQGETITSFELLINRKIQIVYAGGREEILELD